MNNLPVINLGPIHTTYLRVMKKNITFRPFTVMQEKGIISAIDSEYSSDIINNYINIAKSCVQEELNWEKMALIDFMLISILLRAKSQGETLTLEKKECKNCKKSYPFEINIEDSLIFENEDNLKSIVEIDDKLSIEIIPFKIDYLYDLDNLKNEIDIYISIISHSISKIYFNDQIYTNLASKDIKENCVNNLTKFQLKSIIKEIENLISMKLVFEIECIHCKTQEIVEMSNFLEL